MALVPCHVCNSPVADDAPNCMKCGTPGPEQQRKKKLIRNLRLLAFFAVLVALGYAWFVLIPGIQQHGLLYNGS